MSVAAPIAVAVALPTTWPRLVVALMVCPARILVPIILATAALLERLEAFLANLHLPSLQLLSSSSVFRAVFLLHSLKSHPRPLLSRQLPDLWTTLTLCRSIPTLACLKSTRSPKKLLAVGLSVLDGQLLSLQILSPTPSSSVALIAWT